MISLFAAYKDGLAIAWREKKLLFLIYFFNIIFAYLLALPVSMMFSNALAKTTAAEKMLKSFDYALYTNIRGYFGQGLSLGRLVLTFGLFYLILNIFFSGGIIHVFVSKQKFQLTEFFTACSRYFRRFVKLFGISVVFILISFLVYGALSILFGLITKNAATEHSTLILFIFKVLILIGMLIFINMLFDYAKIMTVVNDHTRMFETVKNSLLFVMMALVKTVSLYKLYLFSAILCFLLYVGVESILVVSSAMMVVVFFLWSQIYIILKLWLRLSFFAGQYTFYLHSNTAMPGMSRQMLEDAVENYEKRAMSTNQ